ncbi:MAG: MFS transporter [Clostridiales bacterium 38-18]|nr:MAG: MFS transporter [Clostridiales bacterium 38-18]
MKKSNNLMLILFLLGIFLGAIDSGIVSPAREVIQHGFGIDASTGIWMITIYTLMYAVSMPITSKMADRIGHKRVYVFSITVFMLGSLFSGLTNYLDSYALFLVARVVQAIGAGGILPIATTVIGQSFPEEKRGTALGLVGMIYGVATIIGPTMGSALLTLVGLENWGVIFLINVPIALMILVLSRFISSTGTTSKAPIDFIGAALLAGFIGSLMYALTNLNFFHFIDTIQSITVWPFLIIAVGLLPFVIKHEMRVQDPIVNLKLFGSRQMVFTLGVAFITGIGLMGMVFVPQFGENTLKIASGKGGYLVTLLAVFSGFAAPISGKLLDKKGGAFVLRIGFACSIVGTLILALLASKAMTWPTVILGLAFMGVGVGFTMGAPLNYLVLNKATKENGASALATMSLIRSLGVAISPNIMIGFIVNAGGNVMNNISAAIMPSGMSFPAGGEGISPELLTNLQNADVTNIVSRLTEFLDAVVPANAKAYVLPAIEKSADTITSIFQTTINEGYAQMFFMTAAISLIGFMLTLFIEKKKVALK